MSRALQVERINLFLEFENIEISGEHLVFIPLHGPLTVSYYFRYLYFEFS
jgi:hypothetical protein